MRRYLIIPAAALAALFVAMSAIPAWAATTDVLTTGKTGGTNVKVGATLKASLKSGTTANFIESGTKSTGVKCKKSAFSAKVTSNPKKPGTAKESLTSQSFSSCTSNVTDVKSIKSVKLSDLPNNVSVSDKSGFPVTVSETSKSKPLKVTVVLGSVLGTVTCVYTAKSVSGHGSNTGNVITFSSQKFGKSSGPSVCFKSGLFSATYGPIKDSSAGNAKVFVN
jgi:hypothetical protein